MLVELSPDDASDGGDPQVAVLLPPGELGLRPSVLHGDVVNGVSRKALTKR